MKPVLVAIARSVVFVCTISCTASAVEMSPVPVSPAVQPAARAWLGVVLVELDEALATHLALENDLGVMVSSIEPGSPAEKMGLRRWDVIVAFEGRPMYTPRALAMAVLGAAPGAKVEVAVRRGPATETVGGALGTAPPAPPERRRGPREDLGRPIPRSDGQVPRSGTIERSDGSTFEWSVLPGAEPEQF